MLRLDTLYNISFCTLLLVLILSCKNTSNTIDYGKYCLSNSEQLEQSLVNTKNEIHERSYITSDLLNILQIQYSESIFSIPDSFGRQYPQKIVTAFISCRDSLKENKILEKDESAKDSTMILNVDLKTGNEKIEYKEKQNKEMGNLGSKWPICAIILSMMIVLIIKYIRKQ